MVCTVLTVLLSYGSKGIKPNPAGGNTVVDVLSVGKFTVDSSEKTLAG